MNKNKFDALIHIAKYSPSREGLRTLYLRKESPQRYSWFEEAGGKEKPTGVSAPSIEEAIRIAHRTWKDKTFRPLKCGFRYTLPERDEHGMNALFHQMASSYQSSNGVYFDEELGHNCFVQNASKEALESLKQLQSSNE